MVDNTDFRMVGKKGALEAPLTSLNFEVWELPERRITAAGIHAWRVAARQGPNARGDASNYIQSVTETPRAIPARPFGRQWESCVLLRELALP